MTYIEMINDCVVSSKLLKLNVSIVPYVTIDTFFFVIIANWSVLTLCWRLQQIHSQNIFLMCFFNELISSSSHQDRPLYGKEEGSFSNWVFDDRVSTWYSEFSSWIISQKKTSSTHLKLTNTQRRRTDIRRNVSWSTAYRQNVTLSLWTLRRQNTNDFESTHFLASWLRCHMMRLSRQDHCTGTKFHQLSIVGWHKLSSTTDQHQCKTKCSLIFMGCPFRSSGDVRIRLFKIFARANCHPQFFSLMKLQ